MNLISQNFIEHDRSFMNNFTPILELILPFFQASKELGWNKISFHHQPLFSTKLFAKRQFMLNFFIKTVLALKIISSLSFALDTVVKSPRRIFSLHSNKCFSYFFLPKLFARKCDSQEKVVNISLHSVWNFGKTY